MATFGWVLEDSRDAFLEATERIPDPTLPKEQSFHCPFCTCVFPTEAEFYEHVYAEHRVERPLIMLRGNEPTSNDVIRASLTPSDVAIANTSFARVCFDRASPRHVCEADLRHLLANTVQAEVKLEVTVQLPDV